MMVLTKEQVIEKYGDVECAFVYYYKFSVSYKGIAPDGAEINLRCGGEAHDVYRFELTPTSTNKLKYGYRYASVTIDSKVVWEEDTEY